jgi:aminobenzoyl-glutamate utilization protein B
MARYICRICRIAYAFALLLVATRGLAQQPKEYVERAIESRAALYTGVASEIWDFAEVGYQEQKSSALLQRQLQDAGFEVQAGVAGIPTAFVATYGSGKPVIGILAEFDALPGLSQGAVPFRQIMNEGAPGHACGHHLYGTASVAAATAVKEWLASSGRPGTVRLYGTPAEEGGSGKVYMVRAGLFDQADVVLAWHPRDRNDASPQTNLAVKSAKFRFRGTSAHASGAPERGRSALDGVEAMNYMANLLREHVPQETRIHYVITEGGLAPNVVPETAEVYYYIRHPEAAVLAEIWERVEQAARGAALGTGTTVESEVIAGSYNRLINTTLSGVVQSNMARLGGPRYTSEEQAFAEKIRQTFGRVDVPLGSERQIQPFEEGIVMSSSDNGDVSWVVPMATFFAATWVPGTASHSWQAVAAGGMSIGQKGMLLAAKTLAMTAVDLFLDDSLIEKARAEWLERRGTSFEYKPLLGDRKPPLDYRE